MFLFVVYDFLYYEVFNFVVLLMLVFVVILLGIKYFFWDEYENLGLEYLDDELLIFVKFLIKGYKLDVVMMVVLLGGLLVLVGFDCVI